MTKEEIEKYIQPGCQVKFNSGDEIYTVYKYYPGSIYIYGYNCSFGIDCIKEIVSWPVPYKITSGWIKFKEPEKNDPWTIQFVTPMEEYVDQWHPVSRTISNYPCIPRRQEHLNLPDRIPDWKIKKDWITDWRPIPPEEQNNNNNEESYLEIHYLSELIKGDEISFGSNRWFLVTGITKRPDGDLDITYLQDNREHICISRKGVIWAARRKISKQQTKYTFIGSGVTIKNITLQTTIKREDKIMLNTVEEIKKLDENNLKEAARKVKEERDNDEVKAAREKLTHLLNCESSLKTQKERIDKELAEVQELIRAFGYPPK